MSGINGDKSRFNRVRKQKIARRVRYRKLLKNAATQSGTVAAPSGPEPKAISAA